MPVKTKKHKKSRAIVRVRRRHHALAKKEPPTIAEAIENVLIKGDLTELSPEQRLQYYKALCQSLGLNPLTRPFEYIAFKERRDDDEDPQPQGQQQGGKLTLYANKSCAEQLRNIHKIAVVPKSKKFTLSQDFATTEVAVMDKTGRTDIGIGVVYLKKWKKKDGNLTLVNLTGLALANAIMKSETKAKRRATLSICGLSMLDETELDSVDVIGGVTKEGRIFHFDQLPEQATPHPDADAAVASLRARGLWCDEHNCARSAKHLETCESSRKEIPPKPPATSSPHRAPDKPASPSGAASSEPQPWKQPEEKPLPVDNAVKLPPVGEITIDWKMNPKAPVLTGQLEEFGVFQAKHDPPIKLEYGADEFWHATPAQVPIIKKLAAENRFTVIEILPEKAPPAGQKATQPAARKGGDSGPGQPASSPPLSSGTIERSIAGMAGTKPVRDVTLLTADGKKPSYRCFDKDLFKRLDAGVGQFAELMLRQNKIFWNIIGARKIGAQGYEDDGKTPYIDNRTREAGNQGKLY